MIEVKEYMLVTFSTLETVSGRVNEIINLGWKPMNELREVRGELVIEFARMEDGEVEKITNEVMKKLNKQIKE